MALRVLLFVFVLGLVSAQSQEMYRWPLDPPHLISGTYGEIRPSHFHAGLDLSTSGRINFPVYAIEKGYVSRIRISPVGYGKSLYITHADGRVSVYAHLNSFSLKIDSIVKAELYRLQVNEIDFLPAANMIKVDKGSVIALSGNSGGSTGPHLHFELRDEKTEVPLNPLQVFRITDNIYPELNRVIFFDLSDTVAPKAVFSSRVRPAEKNTFIADRNIFVLPTSIIGIGISGFDRNIPNGNKGNIFCLRISLDGRLIYQHKLSAISFEESRFANEFSQKQAGQGVLRCFLPSIYPGSLFDGTNNKGRIQLGDTLPHSLMMELIDESGNISRIQFKVKAGKVSGFENRSLATGSVNCFSGGIVNQQSVTVRIPPRVLYSSAEISIENKLGKGSSLKLNSTCPNVDGAFYFSLAVPEKFSRRTDKLILKSKTSALVPALKDDSLMFTTKNFDEYVLMTDTLPPDVKLLPLLKGQGSQIRFNINDKLSGIQKYTIEINGKWTWADLDAKTGIVTVYPEKTETRPLKIMVAVTDRVGNISSKSFEIP